MLALAPLLGLLLVVMVREPWYSNFDVDTLTHFEQVRSVADHGSVGFPNGPVQTYPELRTRWFIHAHGQAWGIVPAGMSYLLAPAMALNGFRGTLRAIWALLGLGAAMVYALTYRMTRKPGVSVAAAWAVVCGTSLPFWATMVAPFVPAGSLGITGVYLATRSADRHPPWRESVLALCAGMASSAALGCHLLWSFPWAGLGAVMFIAPGRVASRLRRSVAYGMGSVPMLSLMAWVNHQRFGTWNPVSYGPCDAHTCQAVANNNQTASAFLDAVKPSVPYILAFALVMFLSRKSPRAMGVAGFLGAAGALVPDTHTREKLGMLVRTLWGAVVDLGNLDMGFPHADDGPGVFHHGWCVRSLLQCAPVVVLAALAGSVRREASPTHRAGLLALGAVVCGVLTGCALRADTGGAYVWGYPFLNVRYVAPLLPCAMVLAAVAVAELPWRIWHPLVAAAVALYGAHWIHGHVLGDLDLTRRQVTHWLPLALAMMAFAATAAWGAPRPGVGGHVAAVLVAVTLGWGGAVTAGIDVPCARTYRAAQDSRTEELARCVPAHRFLLLGGYAMDEALALHDHRDIEFINVGMGPRDGSGARTLVDEAMRPDRPAYLIQDDANGPWFFRWPGFAFHTLPGCPRVQRIVREATPPSSSGEP